MSVNKEARRVNRVAAVNALFAYISRDQSVSMEDALHHTVHEVQELKDSEFATELVEYANSNYGKLKVILKVYAPEFSFEKIAPINRAIIIMGLTELKYIDTPPVVVINEYIEIAKSYGEEKSASFINGVLDAFRKNIGKERAKEEEKE